MSKERGLRLCAEWLKACLELGWKKSELDKLEELWWKYHDENGNLKQRAKGASDAKGDK